ncbi:hypothetical protein R3W88_030577 [Solanum pinnatisectum]|uniref:Uncharacterized protein n=1 Tax=Solanum pinnatisectum TaxID=50273 RepID=A0AAV9LML1_9SOLN|nr:hypothetical protein R3W88_030577 [Solanum pinnatisectum]
MEARVQFVKFRIQPVIEDDEKKIKQINIDDNDDDGNDNDDEDDDDKKRNNRLDHMVVVLNKTRKLLRLTTNTLEVKVEHLK